MPRQKKKAILTSMKLPQSTRRIAELIGDSDRTAGVERLMAQLPLFYKLKIYLEEQVKTGDALAQELLGDMEDLGIEQVYTEAIAEGVIEVGGSWIV